MCYARRQRSSWARIKLSKSLYQNTVPRDLIFLLSSLALSFFYFLLSSILICKNFRDPFQAFLALYFSLVVQFSMISFCLAFARPCYYTTSPRLCQYLFQNFFKKFFRGLSQASLCGFTPPLSRWASILYYISYAFVKNFFYFFPLFLPFQHFKQFLYVILYDFLVV